RAMAGEMGILGGIPYEVFHGLSLNWWSPGDMSERYESQCWQMLPDVGGVLGCIRCNGLITLLTLTAAMTLKRYCSTIASLNGPATAAFNCILPRTRPSLN